jgi:hypothetical protein
LLGLVVRGEACGQVQVRDPMFFKTMQQIREASK